ncbi:hypothetical protein Dda_3295 [Drechslerella dactyloides]|uniref:Dienelactone hydrolase domain-containing protein n=1 Tax=Drechslerella dactyloides TaxID=74499 RepID=A0AAD6J3E7_DREDA|nr:hypothetical protein Dda_3295 [Drechslerella dactyloides]
MADATPGGPTEITASKHLRTQGKPDGNFEEIGGRRTYVVPSPDGSKTKTLIYITDMFGVELLNHQLLADTYAQGGFQVLMPDFLDGDGLPADFMGTVEPKLAVQETLSSVIKATNQATMMATMGPKGIKHREAVSKPKIDAFIAEIRKDPAVAKLGIVGTCWGGRHAILQARKDTGVDAVAALQPSYTATADWEPVSVPVYLAFGENDTIVPVSSPGGALSSLPTSSLPANDIISVLEKKTELDKEIRIFPKQVHGFTHRGDYSSDKDRLAMDEAAQAVVDWFRKYLS